MEINRRDLLAAGAAIGMGIAVKGGLAQEGDAAPRGAKPPAPREVWAPKPVPPRSYVAPNKAIWKLPEILAAHKGQQDWTQHIVHTHNFDMYWISMGPGKKTKTQFYADDRVVWAVQSGQIRVTIEGQQPFVASKSFLVDVPARTFYSMETVGDEPSLRFEVRPADELPSYPGDETPTPAAGWTYVKTLLAERGSYDDAGAPKGANIPYLDFQKDVVEANGKSSQFVIDGHTSFHIIRGPGVPLPPPNNFGHFHENFGEVWLILEGKLDVLLQDQKELVHGEVGDVIQALPESWHRASCHEGGMATRFAITPRQLGGQSHYTQTDLPPGGGGGSI